MESFVRRHREAGRTQGWAESLAWLLGQKFGKLPAHRRAQLNSAELSELTTWQEQLLEAKDLDEVFSGSPP